MSFTKDRDVETYKSMISIGTDGLKTLQLLSVGAIVALRDQE
jgi:hypothetical protein